MLNQMLKPPKMLFVAIVAMMIAPFAVILFLFVAAFSHANPDWRAERARIKAMSKEERERDKAETWARLKTLCMPFWHRLSDWIER